MAVIQRSRSVSPFRLNSFRLEGLQNLDACYRLIEFTGLLASDDDYEKKVRLLANLIASALRLPVEPLRLDKRRILAVVGSRERLNRIVLPEQLQLNPEVACLKLDEQFKPLRFQVGDAINTKLARHALLWAIRGVLNHSDSNWWQYGNRFVSRKPDEDISNDQTTLHPAFYIGVIPGAEGTFELTIDPSMCYVERYSLYQKYGADIPDSIKGNRYLYRNGNDWYKIDAIGIAGTASKEMMVDPDTRQSISIYQRILNRWSHTGLISTEIISPDAPTIAYKTVGQQSRRALSDLLYGLPGISVDQDGEPSLHHEAILDSDNRGNHSESIIKQLQDRLTLFGQKLNPHLRMRALTPEEVQQFPDPQGINYLIANFFHLLIGYSFA